VNEPASTHHFGGYCWVYVFVKTTTPPRSARIRARHTPRTARITPPARPAPELTLEMAVPHLEDAAHALLILLASRPTPRVEHAYRALCEVQAELLGTTPQVQAAHDIAALGLR
jgi:hypothetical protein